MKGILISIFILAVAAESRADSLHLGLKIQYQTAMSHVEKKDMPIVDMLVKVGKLLPDSKFLIAGHTDTVGNYEMNIELSKGRAEILKLLLVRHGMDPDRIETKWFSYDAPIATNETEEGRALNRRVVATVYNLTPDQAVKLAKAAERSSRFYVIKIENEKVDDMVEDLQEVQEEVQQEVAEPEVSQEDLDKQREREEEEARLREIEIEQARLRAQEAEERRRRAEEAARLRREARRKALAEKQRYYLSWALTDNTLDATRPAFEAIWVTDFNHAVSAGYQYRITKSSWFGANVTYNFQKYRLENNPIYNWDGTTSDLIRAAIAYDYQPNKKWAIGFDINYNEENFVITNGLTIDLIKASLIGPSLRGMYKFIDTDSYSSRFKLLVEYPIIGSGTIEPKGGLGFSLGADLSFKKWIKNKEVNVGVTYGIRNFENIQNQQVENFIGIEFKFRNNKWF